MKRWNKNNIDLENNLSIDFLDFSIFLFLTTFSFFYKLQKHSVLILTISCALTIDTQVYIYRYIHISVDKKPNSCASPQVM